AHAGAHRIDVAVAAGDSDLATRTRLAGGGDDADDALVDLGHFHLEELHEQAHVGAAQDDLRAARLAIDVLEERDDPIAGPVALARRLLARRQDRFGAAEVDDDVRAALEPAHDAGDQLALTVLVLVEDQLALCIAHALDDHLLG